jgi:DNA-binding NarL/FixJ family response regulator
MQLLESIRVVHGGDYFVGRECMADLVSACAAAASRERRRPPRRRTSVDLRERQIVSAVVNAYQNKEIAEKFAISEKTVKHPPDEHLQQGRCVEPPRAGALRGAPPVGQLDPVMRR